MTLAHHSSNTTNTTPPGRSIPRAEIFVLAVLIAGAAVVRFVNLGDLPLGALGTEEGTSWIVTLGQMQHGYPVLPTGLLYFKGWPYTLLAALVSALFGLSSWALRVPSALAGVASVPLAWWGTRSVLRRMAVIGWPVPVASLFAAYLMAFSLWGLLMNRWGRFYSLGQALFLAGFLAAVCGFDTARRTPRSVYAFSILAVLASATFHPGVTLLAAAPAALLLGTRFETRETVALVAGFAGTVLWFAGVLFFWKTGNVESTSGWHDFRMITGMAFWKHLLILVPLSLMAWSVTVRRGSGSRAVTGLLLLLVVLEAVIFVAAGINGVDTGVLRGFQALAARQPGLMVLAFAGTLGLLVVSPRLSLEGRRTAGMVWLMTVLPMAAVGSSTGKFAPRYLFFALGPMAVVISAGIGLAIDCVRQPALRLAVAAVLVTAAPIIALPSVNPRAALAMMNRGVGDPWPEVPVWSPTAPYVLDLEGPSRFVAAQLTREDVVISTARSVPEAIIGRMDYFFRVVAPGREEAGGPFNALSGGGTLSSPDQVLELCRDRRVFVIVDVLSMETTEGSRLRSELLRLLDRPAFTARYVEVYVLPRGCRQGPEPGPRG